MTSMILFFFHFFNFVVFFKIILKKFNHFLAIDYIWRYKFVKIIIYFGYKP
jgi:hypothetical protein